MKHGKSTSQNTASTVSAPRAPSLQEAMQLTLQELCTYQIELEMQNKELRRAQEALDAERSRYFDLYDLAPVGYVTVSQIGVVLQANLTAATLLGVPRGELRTQAFIRFIFKADQRNYFRQCQQLMATGESSPYELRIVRRDGTHFWAQLMTSLDSGNLGDPQLRLVMSDITLLKIAVSKQL